MEAEGKKASSSSSTSTQTTTSAPSNDAAVSTATVSSPSSAAIASADAGVTMRRNAKHIKLKVGEEIFETTVGTLVSHGGIFQAMFEGQSAESMSDAYFIDRKFKHFGIILEFLRTNILDIPKTFKFVQVLELMAEFNYFNIKVDLYAHNMAGFGEGIYQGPRNEKGEPEGSGRFWATNDKLYYEGSFLAGKFQNKGKLHSNTGQDLYEGGWKEGKRNGKGKKTSGQETIIAEWKNDSIVNIDCYIGTDGRKVVPKSISTFSRAANNDCTIEWSNGDSYEGKYDTTSKSFHRQGKGVMTYADGSKYEGEWEKDKRHGRGKFTSGDGYFTYDGEWRQDKENGAAYVTYKEEWRQGKRVYSDHSRVGL